MMACLSWVSATQAADGLSLSSVSVLPGEEAELKVSISQESRTYTGFQFDIEMADGLTLVATSSGKLFDFSQNQDNDPVCDVESIGGNVYRFVVYSNNLSSFKNGEVMSLRIKADSQMAYGEYLLTQKNLVLSDRDGRTTKPDSKNYKLRVVANQEEESISLESVVIKTGETENVSLSIQQEYEKYTGFQFDLTLPDGLSLEAGADGKMYELSGNQTNSPVCDVELIGDNTYRFVVYSNTLTPFKNGNVISLHMKAESEIELKSYSVLLSQIALSDADGDVTKLSNRVSAIKVTGFFMLTYKVDGTVYKAYEIEYGTSITPEAEPTKEGYTFSGWSEIPATMPAKDVEVKGTFTVNKYNLTYKVDGEVYKTYEIEYGATITPEVEPTKDGYTFSGWSEIPTTMPAKDIEVIGTFTINKYMLTYKVDGEVYKTYEIEYGATITPEAEPTKEGYTFSGWSEIPTTMPAKDVEVTGTFSRGAYKLTYVVDGETYKTVTYNYGDAITPEPAPAKVGYTFSGWSEIPKTMPAKDVEVTGTFTINKYTLTYKVDGEVYKTYEVEYGASITLEAEPTKEGYTFSGWSEIPTTMPAKDVEVTGTFTINKYTLTYKVDGEVYKTYEVEYGTTITPEAEPTKEGYTFSGWSEIPATMPAKDVEVTGTFSIEEYEVNGVTYGITNEGVIIIKGTYDDGKLEITATIEINGVTYPVVSIANGAFKGLKNLVELIIAKSITTIGDNAFEGCSNLRKVRLGSGLRRIGSKAFANINSSRVRTRGENDNMVLFCEAENVPDAALDVFESTDLSLWQLVVPNGTTQAYSIISPWSDFGKIVDMNTYTGIVVINRDVEDAKIYDFSGNRIDTLRKGVNIMSIRNGETKKVVKK